MANKKKPTKIAEPKTPAEKICEGVDPNIKAQAVTLANAVLVMQEKIETQIPIYKQMPLAQQVTVGHRGDNAQEQPRDAGVPSNRSRLRERAKQFGKYTRQQEDGAGSLTDRRPASALRHRLT